MDGFFLALTPAATVTPRTSGALPILCPFPSRESTRAELVLQTLPALVTSSQQVPRSRCGGFLWLQV